MMKVRVFKAGSPRHGEWVLMWRTPTMPAPSFFYYRTRAEAEAAALRMKPPVSAG